MATATPVKKDTGTAVPPMLRPEQLEGLTAARARLGELQEKHAAIAAELMRGRAESNVVLRSEFRTRERTLEHDLLLLESNIEKQTQVVAVALDAVKAEYHARYFTLKCAQAPKVAAALLVAQREMEAFRQLEIREGEKTGDYIDFISLPAFMPSTADGRHEGAVERWVAAARAQGLLD